MAVRKKNLQCDVGNKRVNDPLYYIFTVILNSPLNITPHNIFSTIPAPSAWNDFLPLSHVHLTTN